MCSRCPLSPAPANRATAALIASSGARKSPIRTSCPARGSGSKAGRPCGCGGLARRALDQLHQPGQRDPAGHRRDPAAEQGQPLAAAHQEARQRDEDQFGAVAFGRPLARRRYSRPRCSPSTPRRRATATRSAPPPIRSRGHKAAAIWRFCANRCARPHRPADTGGIARRSRPGRRGAGRARPAPRSGRPVRRRPGAAAAPPQSAPPGRAAAPARPGAATARSLRDRRSPQRHRHLIDHLGDVTPSARPAKLTAMRWRSTGGASASTSSTEGA